MSEQQGDKDSMLS